MYNQEQIKDAQPRLEKATSAQVVYMGAASWHYCMHAQLLECIAICNQRSQKECTTIQDFTQQQVMFTWALLLGNIACTCSYLRVRMDTEVCKDVYAEGNKLTQEVYDGNMKWEMKHCKESGSAVWAYS